MNPRKSVNRIATTHCQFYRYNSPFLDSDVIADPFPKDTLTSQTDPAKISNDVFAGSTRHENFYAQDECFHHEFSQTRASRSFTLP
uniref:Uncharacterized protein n=1 Tax=Candidatus Kentrum sp. MB TaxID=2138164 RepID=A0A450XG39_9GAMM|nr:MAG: hypothetical protein BECKMB1821G_GA0114241_103425 [Candidatus Kentron sp. MB]